jgi:tetratricopeptide (TPR) repeat protein
MASRKLDEASVLFEMAAASLALGEYDKARDSLVLSLALQEEELGAEHPGLEATLGLLANLQIMLNRPAEGKKILKQLLAIKERVEGRDSTELIVWIQLLAVAHSKLGEWADGIAMYERALQLGERALGKGHPDLENTVTMLKGLRLLKSHEDQEEKARRRVEQRKGWWR